MNFICDELINVTEVGALWVWRKQERQRAESDLALIFSSLLEGKP